MTLSKKLDVSEPADQLELFGYKNYLYLFKNLFEKKKLPNAILISGQKGLGKSTFSYHFINYLLSQKEENKYSFDDFTINENNLSFKLIKNSTHPNFFLLNKNSTSGSIKIDQTRNLLSFLNKTTYSRDIKIVLLDHAGHLNINSSNALLKALEEPSSNTFFFIIHNDSSQLIDTIKSRCVPFKIHFTISEKKNIFMKINQNYQLNLQNLNLDDFLFSNTPGTFLKYLLFLKDSNLNVSKDYLPCILFLLNLYQSKKNSELLYLISLFIEKFYNDLALKNSTNINTYSVNRNKILYLINDTDNFYLDVRNSLFTIGKILKNEEQ